MTASIRLYYTLYNYIILYYIYFYYYLRSLVYPPQLCVNASLVYSLEFSKDYGIAGLQDLYVMAMSISREERDAGNIGKVEEVGLLNGGAIIHPSLNKMKA